MIRVAHILDIPRLLVLSECYVKEVVAAGLFVPQFDAELAAVNMMNTMASETGLAIVAVQGTTVVGVLWAFVVQPVPWSPHLVADCQMFYVHPDYRGGIHTNRMIKAFKVWAETMDCVEVRISTASGLDTIRVERLFQLNGFKPLGTTYHITK